MKTSELNKKLNLPCLKGRIGDWFYYCSTMSFDEIARRVKLPIEIDKKYFRPTEVNSLKGDSSKARRILGWKPNTNIKSLIKEMIESENSY